MYAINWSASEIRCLLTERFPNEAKTAKKMNFIVYPAYGEPKLRFVQSIAGKFKGPLVYVKAAAQDESGDWADSCPFVISDVINESGVGYASTFADTIDMLLYRRYEVVLFGADREEYVLSVNNSNTTCSNIPDDAADADLVVATAGISSQSGVRDEF